MAIEICPRCTCQFAVGLLRCPQCDAVAPLFADQVTQEEPQMARITVGAGPTNALAAPGEPGYIEPAAEEPAAVVEEPVTVEPPVVEAPVVVTEQQDAKPTSAKAAKEQLADSSGSAPSGDTSGA